MTENMKPAVANDARKNHDTIYIYGLDENYNLVHYFFITKQNLMDHGHITSQIKSTAAYLKDTYPGVAHIFMVDNSRDIYRAFKELRQVSKLENHVQFKMMLEQYGFRIQL